jgi:hypothetical protein
MPQRRRQSCHGKSEAIANRINRDVMAAQSIARFQYQIARGGSPTLARVGFGAAVRAEATTTNIGYAASALGRAASKLA